MICSCLGGPNTSTGRHTTRRQAKGRPSPTRFLVVVALVESIAASFFHIESSVPRTWYLSCSFVHGRLHAHVLLQERVLRSESEAATLAAANALREDEQEVRRLVGWLAGWLVCVSLTCTHAHAHAHALCLSVCLSRYISLSPSLSPSLQMAAMMESRRIAVAQLAAARQHEAALLEEMKQEGRALHRE